MLNYIVLFKNKHIDINFNLLVYSKLYIYNFNINEFHLKVCFYMKLWMIKISFSNDATTISVIKSEKKYFNIMNLNKKF